MDLKYLLLKTFRQVEELSLKLIEKKGFTEKDCLVITRILTILANERCSISELSRYLGISRQAMHKHIQKLLDENWIILEENINNKRAKIITLSKLGNEIIRKRKTHMIKIEKDIAKKIGEENLSSLKSFLISL